MKNKSSKQENIFVTEEEKTINWPDLQSEFRKNFGDEIYSSWLKNITLVREYNDYLILGVPTRFFRDWIVSRYLDKILELVKSFKLSLSRIEFKIIEDPKNNRVEEFKIEEFNKVTEIKDSILNYNRLNPNLNFENFIKGTSNEVALSYSKKVCEHTSRYNPLYIYGGVGLGKTHLLNAIGLELQSNKEVMFISAERFMYHFIKSIKKNDMVNFKDFFRKSSVFIIDDIQFIRGKEISKKNFHTFNSLLEKGSQIIISADRPPMKLDRVQERIKSRLSGGLIIDIDVPDLELKKNIISNRINHIQNQFKEHINISEDVTNYIATEAKTNIRELIGVLNRVIAFSRLHKKVLNINDCKNILKDVFSQAKIVTVDKIQNTVSNYFNISLNDMLSQRRSRPLARPRQIAMFLAKRLTTRSLPEIGRRFANRDHTTVIHAVKTITKLSEKDEEMKKNLIQIKSLLLEN